MLKKQNWDRTTNVLTFLPSGLQAYRRRVTTAVGDAIWGQSGSCKRLAGRGSFQFQVMVTNLRSKALFFNELLAMPSKWFRKEASVSPKKKTHWKLPSKPLTLDLMQTLDLFFTRVCYYQIASYRQMNRIKVVDKLSICKVGSVHFWHRLHPKKLWIL